MQALPPRPCPKIPAKLLQDVSPNGPVFAVAKKCEEIRRSKNLKKVDFANPARRKEVQATGAGPSAGHVTAAVLLRPCVWMQDLL